MPAGPAPTGSSSSTPGGRRLGPAAFVSPLVAASLGLLLVFDLAHHMAVTLALLGAAFLGLLLVAPRLEAARFPVGRAVLLGALLLRLPLLPLPPTLSDDVLRYLWDGKVAAAGMNPYALAPEAEKLTPLRDEIWRRLPHKGIPTVYPPLSLAAFSIAIRLPFPMPAWKLIATGADLAVCWLLLLAAARRGLPAGRTVWYAWNPLVALEVAGMGHVDALGVAAVAAAVLLLLPSRAGARPLPAGTAAAAGILAKLVPLAALPMWARQSRHPVRFLTAALGLTAVAALPVVAATGGVPPGLVAYGVTWEFDGPLFEPLWRLLGAAGAAPALAHGLDRLKAATGIWQGLNFHLPLSLSPIPGQAPPRRRDGRRGRPLPARARSGGRHRAALRPSPPLLGDGLSLVPPLGAPLGGAAARRGLAGALGADLAVVPAAVRGGCAVAVGVCGDLGAVFRDSVDAAPLGAPLRGEPSLPAPLPASPSPRGEREKLRPG